MCEVSRAGRISSPNRAFVEVTLENVAPAECLLTQAALIRSFAGVYAKSANSSVETLSAITYDASGGASGASSADRSCCSSGKGTCSPSSCEGSCHCAPSRQGPILEEAVDLERLEGFLFDLESRRRASYGARLAWRLALESLYEIDQNTVTCHCTGLAGR